MWQTMQQHIWQKYITSASLPTAESLWRGRFVGLFGILGGVWYLITVFQDPTTFPPFIFGILILIGSILLGLGIWIAWCRPRKQADVVTLRRGEIVAALSWIMLVLLALLFVVIVIIYAPLEGLAGLFKAGGLYTALLAYVTQVLWLARRGHADVAGASLFAICFILFLGFTGQSSTPNMLPLLIGVEAMLTAGLLWRWWAGLAVAVILPLTEPFLNTLGLINGYGVFIGSPTVPALVLFGLSGIVALHAAFLHRALHLADQRANQLSVAQDTLAARNRRLVEQTDELQAAQTHLQQLISELKYKNQQNVTLALALQEANDQLAKQNSSLEATVAARTSDLQHAIVDAEQARATAEAANRLKSQFLANMSHELRTPLNAILNFTRFLSKERYGALNQRQTDLQGRVLANAEHLLGLINDILDLAKIEAGQLELRQEVVDLRALVQSVMSTASGLTREKQLTFELDLPPHLPSVWADATRVRQVLLNLVSNAVKFTESGGIRLVVVRYGALFVRVSVEDTGVGIAPEHQELVFKEFRQVDGELNRASSGTGLGLPISRRLIELHGGQLWLESEVNQGSTFHFTLPLLPTLTTAQNGTPLPLSAESPTEPLVVATGDAAALIEPNN